MTKLKRIKAFQSNIAKRLILALVLFSSLITVGTTAVQLYFDYQTDLDKIHEANEQIQSSYLKTLTNSLWAFDDEQINTQLTGMLELPDMEYIAVNVDGKVRWSKGKIVSGATLKQNFPITVTYNDRQLSIGILETVVSITGIYDRLLKKAFVILISNAIKTFLVVGFVFIIFHFLVTRRIEQLAENVRNINIHSERDSFKSFLQTEKAGLGDEIDQLILAIATVNATRGSFLRSLKQSETRLTEIISIAPEAIIIIGQDMKIQFFNQSAERIFGYQSKEVSGLHFDLLMPKTARMNHAIHVKHFDQSDDTYLLMMNRTEILGLKKNGQTFPATASVSKVEINGEHLYTVLLSDITRQKKAERKMLKAKKQAEAANRTKTRFLANMSHELRTPLNAVIGFSGILMGQGMLKINDARSKEYANHIHQSAHHLLNVIQDILDISKIERQEFELEFSPVDMQKLVKDGKTMIRDQANEKQISVTSWISSSLPVIIGDEIRLKQVLINLLSNAVKFTPKHGKIRITAKFANNHNILLAVADTGIGIKTKDIAKVMKPFGQVKDIMKRDHEGTGLGLSLANELVKMHGGKIDISRNINNGCTVSVSLPLHQP